MDTTAVEGDGGPVALTTRNDKDLSATEKTRLDIENGIKHHDLAILDLKRRYNALSSTSCLPPELLAEIFIYHALAESEVPRQEQPMLDRPPHVRRHKTSSFHPYSWIRVTHVCSHWRAVALSSPQVWGTIWLTKIDCVREMLARAKRVPLTVKATMLQGRMDSLELIMRELPRIISFDVKMPPHMPKKDFGLQAPRLKELILQSAEGYEMLTLGTSQMQSHFMQCDIPSLERLELYAFQVQWSNPLLKPTIRHLTLHATGVSAQLSIEEVIVALESLPLLESLNLKHVLPPVSGQALPDVSRVITLPHLRNLRIFGSSMSCANFLRHTSFPTSVILSVDCHMHSNAETAFLFPVILEKLSSVPTSNDTDDEKKQPAPPLRSLSIHTIGNGLSTQMKGWTTPQSLVALSDKSHNELPEPTIEISVRVTGQFSIFGLYRAVPSSDIESLFVDPSTGVRRADKVEWTRMFEGLPKLRELGVGRWGQDHLHQVLDHRVSCEEESAKRGGRKKKGPCIPNLSVLMLTNMYVRPSPSRTSDDVLFTRLRRSLKSRQRSKVPLETLVIRSCANLYQEDVDTLKQYVGAVDWDNVNRAEGMHHMHAGWEEWDLMDEEDWDDPDEEGLGHVIWQGGWGTPDPWAAHAWPMDAHFFDDGFDDGFADDLDELLGDD